MSVSAADAGNSSNSNFHKIQIDSNTQNTIDNNTNYYKSNDNLNKNDNINLKNQYTKQEKNENNTYTKNNNLEDKDVYNTLNNVENYDINSNLNNSETITNMVSNSSNKDNISIDLPNYSAYAGKVITINATIKTKNGTPLNLAKAAFKVNGNTKAHLNVTNGKLIYAFKIPQWSAKKYNLTLVVGETNTTNSLSKNSTLTLYKLNTTINTPYLTFSQKDKVSYVNATIKDQLNRTVYTGNTSIKINGITIGHYNTSNGIINFNFTQTNKLGTQNLTIIYGENTFFNSAISQTKIRIINTTIHTYTYSQILEAANRVKNFKDKNKRLPTWVVINNNDVTMVDFLYLMCQSLHSNDSLSEGNFGRPSVVKENITTGNIYKDEYLNLSKEISQYISNYGVAQGYIKTSFGTLMLNSTIDGFSRALAYTYNHNGVLPNYISYNQSTYPITTNTTGNTTTNTTDPYLLPSHNCQSNDAVIISLSKNLTKGCTSVLSKATNIFNYVRDYIKYDQYENTRYGAVKTLSRKLGNCCDQAHLLVALLRAANIRAGYAHAECQFNSGIKGHVWAKIYLNNEWVDADPTSRYNSIGNTKSNTIISWRIKLTSEILF